MKPLLALGVAELALLVLLGWSDPGFPFPGICYFLLAFVTYVGAWAWVRETRPGTEGHALLVVWLLAVLFRAALLPLDPRLSDDVYRYLWDGHVLLAGVNPFSYAPADPAVAWLRTEWHGLINNPTVPTIYPPIAQAAFALIGLLGSTVVAAKALWILLDLACGWLLLRVAAASGRPRLPVAVLYLWSPLLIVETSWSGHLEPLGLLAVAATLLLAVGRRRVGTGVALGLAAMTKFAPAAALPAVVRRFGPRALMGFALACLAYVPFAWAGPDLWVGLTTYAEHWRFNEGGFWLFDRVLPGRLFPRWAAGAAVLGVVGLTALRRFDTERALLWVLGTGIALSPTVHPWYVLWVLPFVALRATPAWLYLSGAVFLAYWGLDAFHATGVWPEPLPVRLVIWTPFWALLLWDAVRRTRTG